MRHILLLSCLVLFATTNTINAQYWEVSGMGGVTLYHGDIAPDFSFQAPGAAGSFFARRNVDPRVSLRFGASFGTISASDEKSLNAYNKTRNLSFQSTIFEGSIGFEFNFLPFHHHYQKGRNQNQFTPYLVAGFGVFYHNPKAEYKGSLYALQPLGTEGQAPSQEYSLVQPALIVGAGFKIDINAQWGIVIEGATRVLFFDYLDDISGSYADPRVIKGHRGSLGSVAVGLADRSGEVGQNLGRPGRQRGDSNTNDGYTMFTIGVLYTIHQYECPTW